MKINQIVESSIEEGPMDFFRNVKAAAGASGQSFKQNQAIDRRNANYNTKLNANINALSKDWSSYERSLPNRAALNDNPKAYFKQLAGWAAGQLNAKKVPSGVTMPDQITPQNVQNVISQISQKLITPTAIPGQVSPQISKPARQAPTRGAGGKFVSKAAAPAATPTAAPSAKPKVRVPAGSAPVATPAAAPKPAARAKPTTGVQKQPATGGATTPAARATPASTKTAAPTFNQLQSVVNGLTAAEKRKLLGQLLKSSNVKVAAAK
jgi:hypothetical protein